MPTDANGLTAYCGDRQQAEEPPRRDEWSVYGFGGSWTDEGTYQWLAGFPGSVWDGGVIGIIEGAAGSSAIGLAA